MKPASMAFLFVILNLVDAATTAHLVARGAFEANPIMACVISLGFSSFLAVKGFGSFLGGALLARLGPRPLKAACSAFGCIVAWQTSLCLFT
jgi:hypothetical protein